LLTTVIFQRAKLSTRSITYLCRCNWSLFWRRKMAESSQRWSCPCGKIPRLTGHLQPRRKWLTWASSVFITHPILRIWSHWTTTCSLDWKNNWNITIYRPIRRSLLLRRHGHTDNTLNYFWVAW